MLLPNNLPVLQARWLGIHQVDHRLPWAENLTLHMHILYKRTACVHREIGKSLIAKKNCVLNNYLIWNNVFLPQKCRCLFSCIFILSLNVRRKSRENWTPAQSGRLDWVGARTSLRSLTPAPPLRVSCSLFLSRASDEFEGIMTPCSEVTRTEG